MINVNGDPPGQVRAAPAPDPLWWKARDLILGVNMKSRDIYGGLILASHCTNEEAIWICDALADILDPESEYHRPMLPLNAMRRREYAVGLLKIQPDSAYKTVYLSFLDIRDLTLDEAIRLGHQFAIANMALNPKNMPNDLVIIDPALHYRFGILKNVPEHVFIAAEMGWYEAIRKVCSSKYYRDQLGPFRYVSILEKGLEVGSELTDVMLTAMYNSSTTMPEVRIFIGRAYKRCVDRRGGRLRGMHDEMTVQFAIQGYTTNVARVREAMDAWVCIGRRLQAATNKDIRRMVAQMLWDERAHVYYM